MPFQIVFKFMDEEKAYTCYVNYEQYKNLKELPSIRECRIMRRNQETYEDYEKEMQVAINKIADNDTSHIHKLSENI